MLTRMSNQPLLLDQSDYVLMPSVTHPQGRARAFSDTFKAVVRFIVEIDNNPALGYAVDKTDRVVTSENMGFLSDDELDEWVDACDEFDLMSPHQQNTWIGEVLATYPKLHELPAPDLYNHIH